MTLPRRAVRNRGIAGLAAITLGIFGCAHSPVASKRTPHPPQHERFLEEEAKIQTKDGRIPFLAGTIYRPQIPDPRPGVVLIQGSGPTDRHWNNKYIPLAEGVTGSGKVVAQHLASAGFVVLVFDKRGVGETPKDPSPTESTPLDDVDAALSFLSTHSAVRPCKVALAGHSEGAGFARHVATQHPEIGAVVLLSGTGRTLRTLLREQITNNMLRPAGVTGEDLELNLRYMEKALEAVAQEKLLPVEQFEIHPKIQEFVKLVEAAPGRTRVMVAGFDDDPTTEMAKLKMPMMIVGGGRDIQIRRQDFEALSSAAPSAKRLWIEDMDHVLKKESRSVEELSKIIEEKGPGLYGEARPVHEDLLRGVTDFLISVMNERTWPVD